MVTSEYDHYCSSAMGLALPVVAVLVVQCLLQCLFHVMEWLRDTRQGCASSVVVPSNTPAEYRAAIPSRGINTAINTARPALPPREGPAPSWALSALHGFLPLALPLPPSWPRLRPLPLPNHLPATLPPPSSSAPPRPEGP